MVIIKLIAAMESASTLNIGKVAHKVNCVL